jgi:hypothetical protein
MLLRPPVSCNVSKGKAAEEYEAPKTKEVFSFFVFFFFFLFLTYLNGMWQFKTSVKF